MGSQQWNISTAKHSDFVNSTWSCPAQGVCFCLIPIPSVAPAYWAQEVSISFWMDKCIATRGVSKGMFFIQARAKKGFHQYFHYVYFTTIFLFFFCLKASFFSNRWGKGQRLVSPLAGVPAVTTSPPGPMVSICHGRSFFCHLFIEDERLPPIHPCIHPTGQGMRPQQPLVSLWKALLL